jgi:hypothetical protein
MHIPSGQSAVRRFAGLLAIAASLSACGAEEDSGGTETVTSKLEINVPYVVNNQTLTARSGTAGDATLFNNQAVMAYIRPDSTIGIVVDSSVATDDRNALTYGLPGPAQYGPALLALNGTLYLFYVQTGTHGRLMMQRSTDALHWDNPIFADGTWGAGGPTYVTPPVAVAWDGIPIVFVAQSFSSTPPQLIQFNINGNSSSWFFNATEYTRARPSATVWKGALYLAWVDAQSSGQVGIRSWTDATGWSGETLTNKTGIPAIYPTALGNLEMVLRAGDSHIATAVSSNGVTFSQTIEDNRSTTNHAAVPFVHIGNSDYNWVFYVGVDNELFTVFD